MTPEQIEQTLSQLRRVQSSLDQAAGRREASLARLKSLGCSNIKAARTKLKELEALVQQLEAEAEAIAEEVEKLFEGADE